jgi:GWxTD domain-containing protein
MMMRSLGAGLVTAMLLAASPPLWVEQSVGQQPLLVSAVRFYRADVGQTQVKAFIQIPYAALDAAGTGPQAPLTYRVTVQVKDSTGLELVKQSWNGHMAAAAEAGASALEILDFLVVPGRYVLHVHVADSATGRSLTSELPVEGFQASPRVSDLLLAPNIRPAERGDTMPAAGEIRRGRLLVTGSAELFLTPLRSKAFYLLELYSATPDSARITMSVKDSTGKAIVNTPPSAAPVPAGGGMLSGALDLTGLPAGRYSVNADIQIAGQTVQRAALFEMAPFSETLAKDVQRREANKVTDPGYFAAMDVAQLDLAQAPLRLIAQGSELSSYDKKLSLNAKRRFMTDFWARRDPTPDTPENEMRERFYQAIAYADQHFKEGGRNTLPGWKTDRGRVYALNGTPDDVLDRQQRGGKGQPYVVWRYNKGKGKWYIFGDRTGFGGYVLLASNDLKEAGTPGWQRMVGLAALEDIAQFLNLDTIMLEPGSELPS